MNSISQNIKTYRKQNNLTQQQMADCLGVTHQTISNWESGRSMPSIDKLNDISEKLNVDINFLLYGKKDSTEITYRIKKYFLLFVFAFLFGIASVIYTEYRLATDVNIRIQSTIDLRYILPNRIYVSLIKPWVYILPVSIGFSFLKFKGVINDRAENKIYIFFRWILILLLVYNTVVFWLVWGLSPVYDASELLYCIPVSIRVWIGNSTVFLLATPGLFSLIALAYEIFRPFKNEKTFIPSDSPGRNNIIAKNIKKIRTERGLSQQQFADRLFITRQTLSNWENGKSMPDVSKLLQICETGEINFNDLFYIKSKTSRKAKLSLLFTVLLITVAVAVIFAYELMWFLVTDLQYRPQWIPYSFPILKI